MTELTECRRFLNRSLFGMKLNRLFAIKSISTESPFSFLLCCGIWLVLSLAVMLRIVEGPLASEDNLNNNFSSFENCIWSVFITMTTVGYGDLFPITQLGRVIIVATAFAGAFLVSMIIISLNNMFVFGDNEAEVML